MDHFYGIYGVGAVLILVASQYFKHNNITLFFGGYVVGTITEYLTSFLVEVIMHAKWWDYSNNILNINGRVCLLYSVFWGILTIFLIRKFQPLLDRILEKIANKIPRKIIKACLSFLMLFLLLDCIATCYAQDVFITRMVIEKNIEVVDFEKREEAYQKIQRKEGLTNFIKNYWDNEKMIKTFPNMKIEDIHHNIIYLDSLLPEVEPYYLQVFKK